MRLTRARLKKIIKEEIGSLGLGEEGGTGDVQSMLDKYSEEKVYSTRSSRPREEDDFESVANSFMLFLKKVPPPPADDVRAIDRRFYDTLNPGTIKPTERSLHKNKDGTYSLVDYNLGLWGKFIEGEDFIFVDKVVKSYYVPSEQTP